MKNILVTGGKGQLASCIKNITKHLEGYHFIYIDLDELDISESTEVNKFFEAEDIYYCVNCAAYTAVDKAEMELDLAMKVNKGGAQNLAEACNKHGAGLIHISTDFVFDGTQTRLYTEEVLPKPLGVYGITKLQGEKAVANTLKEHFIIRTSWLYSEHGHNFLKTMLRLGNEKEELNVVCDQIGTPTYAGDLAKIIIKIITEDIKAFGVYHYSNEGVASWYDFAKSIFDESNMDVKVLPVNTEAYPTSAKRPLFSALDKSKIKKALLVEIPYWRDSLKNCLVNMKQ